MKLIILDRDGVINQDSKDYIKSASEWKAIPGSLPGIARLCQNGFRVIVITNQACLAKKKLDIVALNEIHRKLLDHLSQYGGSIDAFFFCPHEPKDNCNCRKPKTGLLDEISHRLHVPLTGVPMVGDKLIDIEAAIAVGAKPIMVKTGYGEETLASGKLPAGVKVYENLSAVVDDLTQEK